MSVIMMLWAEGDPEALERYAAENQDKMRAVLDHAREHGVIAHRFYGTEGQILVVDEWPDEQSFHEFFDHVGPEIRPMMEAAGVTSEPHPRFWRKLETFDSFGWD
jgi:hypothetical protein